MWNLKEKKVYKLTFTKHKQTHRHGKQTYGTQGKREGGKDKLKYEIKRYKLLYIK